MIFTFNSIKISTNQKVISFLFVLFPLFLITGPFFSDLALSIIAIYFFFIFKKINFKNNPFILIFLTFYTLTLLNSFNFEYFSDSLKSFFFYFRFLFFILVMTYLVNLEKKILNDFFIYTVIAIIIVIISGYYQYANIRIEYFELLSKIHNSSQLMTLKNNTFQRVSGIFGDELIMGSFLLKIFSTFFITFFFINNKKIKQKNIFLFLFLSFLIGLGIIITGDRAPIILFCFQLLLFFLFIEKFRKIIFTFGFLFALSLFLIITQDPISKERVINTTIDEITKDIKDKESNRYTFLSKGYEGHFNAALLIFKNNLFLGSGIKGFRFQCDKLKENRNLNVPIVCSTHPHNYPLHILSETGLVGICIYLGLFIFIILKLFKLHFREIENDNILKLKISIINLIVLFWPLTTSGSFFNNYNSIFFSIGILFYILSNEEVEINKRIS